MDAALGCKTNVFQIHRSSSSSKKNSQPANTIIIHPQASPLVCRHVLDTLIALAKSFPNHFLPDAHQGQQYQKDEPTTPSSQSSQLSSKNCTDFWDVLVKLDLISNNRKGKSALKSQCKFFVTFSYWIKLICELLISGLNTGTNSNAPSQSNDNDQGSSESEVSPMSNIISLLSHPVIRRSSMLTDRLLRLLALISLAFPTSESSATGNNLQQAFQPLNFLRNDTSVPEDQNISSNDAQANKDNETKKENETAKQINEKKDTNAQPEKKSIASEEQLKLAVDVLTSKSCSEEGLEDATALLLRLSRSCSATRAVVLRLLLNGARQLGQVVCQHINSLVEELKTLNSKNKDLESSNDSQKSESPEKPTKGMLQDRFTNTTVVITAPSQLKHNVASREVQLPSMSALTSKASSQSFFLRVLKVIIQLRDSIRLQKNKNKNNENNGVTQMEIDGQDESLSAELRLDDLWEALSSCLLELADTPDHHAVLVLQPAVEAFFLVHAAEKEPKDRRRENRAESHDQQLAHINEEMAPLSPVPDSSNAHDVSLSVSNLPLDTQKFLNFAETHRVVLNQILRQSSTPLADGPFSVLVDHTRVLDFDVKRRYFRQELERLDDGARREDLAVHVRREHVFEDSFRELHRRQSDEWKNRFYIVFEGEEGQDAGGLLREWYTIISREIFNPMYALFTTSPGDRVTYMINSSSHCNSNHLSYFKFVGRVIAKAIYDNKLLECYFTRSFYKHILGKLVKYVYYLLILYLNILNIPIIFAGTLIWKVKITHSIKV